ncbi:MAG: DMT family transporter [Slackia sp.]
MNKDAAHTNQFVISEEAGSPRAAERPTEPLEPSRDNAPHATEHTAGKTHLRESAHDTAQQPKRRRHRHIPLWAYKCMLVLAAAIWGLGTVVIKDAVDTFSPLWLVGLRFSIAGAVLAVVCWKNVRKNLDRDTLGAGVFLGLFVAAQFVFNTAGLTDTTAAKSAFLTGAYCAFVPFLAWAISLIRPTMYNIAAMAPAWSASDWFVCRRLRIASFGFGEAITLLSAPFVGLHIAFMAKLRGTRPDYLTVVQFSGGNPRSASRSHRRPLDCGALANLSRWAAFCIWHCSRPAFRSHAAKHRPCARASCPAALLLATSVFGVLFSIVFLHEVVTAFMVIGFTLIGAGIVVSEALPLKKRRILADEVAKEEMRRREKASVSRKGRTSRRAAREEASAALSRALHAHRDVVQRKTDRGPRLFHFDLHTLHQRMHS